MRIVLLAGLLAPASRACAQTYVFTPQVQWEAQADAIVGTGATALLGIGANVPAGYYLRVGVTTLAGPAWRDGRERVAARMDAAARYLLDPFAEVPWSTYVGGGVTSTWDTAASWRGYLLAVVGVEGPARAGWRTAIELGLGGGTRLGVVLRRARTNGR